MSVPREISAVVRRHRTTAQEGVAWPDYRGRWTQAFPRRAVLSTLPDSLDRQAVRRLCAGVTESTGAVSDAFLAVMVWGYNDAGYGPWRVAEALTDPESGRKLRDVVTVLRDQGPIEAYRHFAKPSRLKRIGPAFGTKFLYFADDGRHKQRALILDSLVSKWLNAELGFRLDPVPWSATTYTEYLNRMHDWAEQLHVDADAIELAIFQDISGGWPRSRR